jgi:hypothetical protein
MPPVTVGNVVWKWRAFALSICHCLACQRRIGSTFGMQAAFKADQVQVVGRFSDFARISDEADRKEHVVPVDTAPRGGPVRGNVTR